MRRIAILISMGLIAASGASPAHADRPVVKFRAWFTPDRPGAGTTIHLGFKVGTESGAIPPPVTSVNVALPPGIEGDPTLGQAVCDPAALALFGARGCSPNAVMGRGFAVVVLGFGASIVRDASELAIFMGPPVEEHTAMVFLAVSKSPVFAEVLFHGALLPNPNSTSGALLQATIPLISSVPGAPDASVISMETTLGPENITYYNYSHGKRTAFTPEGFSLPTRCPRAGFPFVSTLRFADGSVTKVKAVAPCGVKAHHRPRG